MYDFDVIHLWNELYAHITLHMYTVLQLSCVYYEYYVHALTTCWHMVCVVYVVHERDPDLMTEIA